MPIVGNWGCSILAKRLQVVYLLNSFNTNGFVDFFGKWQNEIYGGSARARIRFMGE